MYCAFTSFVQVIIVTLFECKPFLWWYPGCDAVTKLSNSDQCNVNVISFVIIHALEIYV